MTDFARYHWRWFDPDWWRQHRTKGWIEEVVEEHDLRIRAEARAKALEEVIAEFWLWRKDDGGYDDLIRRIRALKDKP